MIPLILSILLLLIPSFSLAADDNFNRLINSRSLRCTFGTGSIVSWEKGKPVVERDKMKDPINFDSIDIKAGKARLIGNQGATDIHVFVTGTGITFIEKTPLGNFTITTIFSDCEKDTKRYIAVHSRHIGGLGFPMPSQFHGTCEVWE